MVKESQIKALLILDPQNDFFGNDNPNLPAFQATIPVINAAISIFREQNWPIFFIQHTSKRKPIGSEIWKIHPAFNYQELDISINKTDLNAFRNTNLEMILREKQVVSVVVCGYISEYCVLSTLRAAFERGFEAEIIEGSIASLEDHHTHFTLEISHAIPLEKIKTKDFK